MALIHVTLVHKQEPKMKGEKACWMQSRFNLFCFNKHRDFIENKWKIQATLAAMATIFVTQKL